GRSPQVTAYVVDNSDERHSREDIAELHRRVWLNGAAPLLYIEWATRVDVLRCATGPVFWNTRKGAVEYAVGETIETTSEVSHALDESMSQRFSASRLANGTFWENPANSDWACADKSAHKRLLNAAIDADRTLQKE